VVCGVVFCSNVVPFSLILCCRVLLLYCVALCFVLRCIVFVAFRWCVDVDVLFSCLVEDDKPTHTLPSDSMLSVSSVRTPALTSALFDSPSMRGRHSSQIEQSYTQRGLRLHDFGDYAGGERGGGGGGGDDVEAKSSSPDSQVRICCFLCWVHVRLHGCVERVSEGICICV